MTATITDRVAARAAQRRMAVQLDTAQTAKTARATLIAAYQASVREWFTTRNAPLSTFRTADIARATRRMDALHSALGSH